MTKAWAGSTARIAADDRQDLAGDEAGHLGRGQKDVGGGDLLGLGRAFHNRLGAELGDGFGVLVGGVQRGPDRARRDHVHADALGGELLRERGITQVTVVGLATDYCVKNTALDALREGFQVTVDSTAVRGVEVAPGDSERALAEVRAAGGVMA